MRFFIVLAFVLFFSTGLSLSHTILDAGGMGIFNIGPAEGFTRQRYDETLEKDVVELEYSIPEGSVMGVWTNNYPQTLDSLRSNAIRTKVKVPYESQVHELGLRLELKGPGEEMQVIPLRIQKGWNTFETLIEWDYIGELKEVVLVVDPLIDEKTSGSILFTAEFLDIDEAEFEKLKDDRDYTILDAGGMGIFNIGPADGFTRQRYDETLGMDVVNIEYSIPEGSVMGVWTNNYPRTLDSLRPNAVRASIKVPYESQVHELGLRLELKGPDEDVMQVIPLRIQKGWNTFEDLIEWDYIGELKEVVLVVDPLLSKEISGNILFTAEFLDIDEITKTEFDPDYNYGILDAGSMGVFDIGEASGITSRIYDEKRDKYVIKFDFKVDGDSVVGVWTQNYPLDISPDRYDAVRAGVYSPSQRAADSVWVKLEIKGDTGQQDIPLELSKGWAIFKEPIQWNKVGSLREVVFVVYPQSTINFQVSQFASPVDHAPSAPEAVEGTLLLDIEFETLNLMEKTEGKLFLVFMFGFILTFLTGTGHKIFGRGRKKNVKDK